jgi:L-ascorbate metabolism protein UlaG (beta-lactamase superfamily)
VLIELDGVRLLTDPVLGRRIGPLVRIAPAADMQTIGPIDAVLISHLHLDHTDLPSLRTIDRSVPIIAPHPAGQWLTRRGRRDVRELRQGSELCIGDVVLRATPAIHDDRRRPLGVRAPAIGFLASGSRSVYFAGDTDLFDEMAELRGSVSVALLPVWGWGSTLGPGHLDPGRAAAAAAIISPAVAIPIHWGTYAMGWPARRPADPQLPAREFSRIAAERAPGVEIRVLRPGERTELA